MWWIAHLISYSDHVMDCTPSVILRSCDARVMDCTPNIILRSCDARVMDCTPNIILRSCDTYVVDCTPNIRGLQNWLSNFGTVRNAMSINSSESVRYRILQIPCNVSESKFGCPIWEINMVKFMLWYCDSLFSTEYA